MAARSDDVHGEKKDVRDGKERRKEQSDGAKPATEVALDREDVAAHQMLFLDDPRW